MQQQLSWIVKHFDTNHQAIEDYDILKYREAFIKKAKKQSLTKEDFAAKLHMEFQWNYWSRSEYELIITVTKDNHILLIPWCGCRDKDLTTIDVTDDTSFDWKGFAEHHIDKQIFGDRAKIDIFDQITYANQFEKLVDYCWHTRLKYERYNPKFDK